MVPVLFLAIATTVFTEDNAIFNLEAISLSDNPNATSLAIWRSLMVNDVKTFFSSNVLCNLSKYSASTIENIVTHEISHTWAHSLAKNKILDYSYSDYKIAVSEDKYFPSAYAKKNVKNGRYDEDFAESISLFLANPELFEMKFPARTTYIKNIINK